MLVVDVPIEVQCIPCKHHATAEIAMEHKESS